MSGKGAMTMDATREPVLEGHPVQATAEIAAPPLTDEQLKFRMAHRLRLLEHWMRVASPPERWSVRKFAMNFTCLHGFKPDSLAHRAWFLREQRLALAERVARGGTLSTAKH